MKCSFYPMLGLLDVIQFVSAIHTFIKNILFVKWESLKAVTDEAHI